MVNIWSEIQHLLHAQLNSGHYKVWIAPLQAELSPSAGPSSCSPDTVVDLPSSPAPELTLYAPTEFVATRVKERYLSTIAKAATAVCGKSVNLELKVGRAANPLAAAELPVAVSPSLEPQPGYAGQQINCPSAYGQSNYPHSIGALSPAAQMGLPLDYALPLAGACATSRAGQNVGQTMGQNAGQGKGALGKYTFESFVVGPCNELAFAAARTLCGEALQAANTLFLTSGPGLGKTHLMQAMGHCIKQDGANTPCRVACLTAEEFGSRMIAAIRAKETDRFKLQYRGIDVLLLEDIHFLQGKEKMQEEVLSTIKYIRDRGGRVVFSSSFAPHELKDLDSQLASRFASGFLAMLEQPCFETRKLLFSQKAKLHHIALPDPVAEYLAEHVRSDVRKIESCLHNLILHARLMNREIGMDLAIKVLEQFAQQDQIIDLDSIVRTVCRAFGMQPDDIVSKSRRANLVSARNAIFYLARKHTPLTLAEIGQRFNRTHTSVIKGIASLEREITRQTPLGMQLGRTIELIEKNSQAYN